MLLLTILTRVKIIELLTNDSFYLIKVKKVDLIPLYLQCLYLGQIYEVKVDFIPTVFNSCVSLRLRLSCIIILFHYYF